MIAAGGKKSSVSVKDLLLRGFYSGAILGLAVILALTVGITVKAPLSAPCCFPGFASIVLFGMELVTGNFCPAAHGHLGRSLHLGSHIPQLDLGVDRNWIGTAVVAVIMAISLTSGTMDGAADNVGAPIWDLVAQKIMALNKINVEKNMKHWEAWASSWRFSAAWSPTGLSASASPWHWSAKVFPEDPGLLGFQSLRSNRWEWNTSW